MTGKNMKLFIEAGSIYSPGWHIYREDRPNHFTSLATFDTKAEAEEELPHIVNYYESNGETVTVGRMP